MRVLYWSELFRPYVGGAEVFGADLIAALQERGYEFLVVTSHGGLTLPDEEVQDGVRIHRMPFRQLLQQRDPALILGAQRRVAELKRSFQPSIIHVNGIGPSALLHLRTASAHRAPTLVCMISEVLGSAVPATLTAQALRAADRVVCVAQAVLGQVRALVPEVAGRAAVIHNGVQPPPIEAAELPWQPPTLLCVGRMIRDKGFDVALDAFGRIVERFPRVRLAFAGDGPERAALERQAAQIGLTGTAEFLGWVEPARIWELINAATILLVPSRREGLPLAAIQAALLERPVIGTRVGGLPEIVLDGESGVLVEKEDVASLTEAIASLLERPDVTRAMGRAARSCVREVCDWERCVTAYDAVYRTLVGAPQDDEIGR